MNAHRPLLSVAPLLLLGATACSTPESDTLEAFDDKQVLVDFADQVVVPTYQLLATRLDALGNATRGLAASPTPATLTAAQEAWIAARVPWEQSEAFLFGPVDALGFDPALDSWPVNRADLETVLRSSQPLTAESLATLQETQKGLHTVEYLLFGEERTRTSDSLGARELQYLTALTAELSTISHALAASWTEGVDGAAAYRDVLATAGEPGNTSYPSLSAAAQEMLQGMIGICDEVANGKLADPYDAHDATLVESQFSLNSLADFQDNLRSVENVYTGSVPAAGTAGRGLSAYVATADAALDAQVKAELAEALSALAAIPGPFRAAITTPSSYDEIEAAQAAIRALQATLEGAVVPLVLR